MLDMAYAIRTRECSKCGIEITGPLPASKPVNCIECAIKTAVEANVQQHNRAGPVYDRWLAGMAKAIEQARTDPGR